MPERPLSDLQEEVLLVLLQHGELIGNRIGESCGFARGGVKASIPKHRTGGGCIRSMGAAQRVIAPLNGLRKRGLVGYGMKTRSGTLTFKLTVDGRVQAIALQLGREMERAALGPQTEEEIVETVTAVLTRLGKRVHWVRVEGDKIHVSVSEPPNPEIHFTATVV
jgi:hypothetical protein